MYVEADMFKSNGRKTHLSVSLVNWVWAAMEDGSFSYFPLKIYDVGKS